MTRSDCNFVKVLDQTQGGVPILLSYQHLDTYRMAYLPSLGIGMVTPLASKTECPLPVNVLPALSLCLTVSTILWGTAVTSSTPYPYSKFVPDSILDWIILGHKDWTPQSPRHSSDPSTATFPRSRQVVRRLSFLPSTTLYESPFTNTL